MSRATFYPQNELPVRLDTVARFLLIPMLAMAGACVSRNIESISSEEAATRAEPPAPLAPEQRPDSVVETLGVDGTITLAEGATMPASGVVFIIVRVSGRAGGAPLAVKQLPALVPATFQVSAADSMIAGTPLVGDLDLIVRYDQDGNAFSRQPGDLEGSVGPVQVGGVVEVVLSPVQVDPEEQGPAADR